jgi:hypothetical protein
VKFRYSTYGVRSSLVDEQNQFIACADWQQPGELRSTERDESFPNLGRPNNVPFVSVFIARYNFLCLQSDKTLPVGGHVHFESKFIYMSSWVFPFSLLPCGTYSMASMHPIMLVEARIRDRYLGEPKRNR